MEVELVANLKTKGTKNSLKAIMNCYGIPSSNHRVREYGGTKNNEKPQSEIFYMDLKKNEPFNIL